MSFGFVFFLGGGWLVALVGADIFAFVFVPKNDIDVAFEFWVIQFCISFFYWVF